MVANSGSIAFFQISVSFFFLYFCPHRKNQACRGKLTVHVTLSAADVPCAALGDENLVVEAKGGNVRGGDFTFVVTDHILLHFQATVDEEARGTYL